MKQTRISAHAATEKSKHPIPEAYSGKREDWKTFSNHLTLYFEANKSQYRSQTEKIVFVISRLGNGPAFKYMQAYIPLLSKSSADHPQILCNYHLFLKTMADNFGMQNAHLVAEAQLRTLRQKGSALDYSNKFLELSADVDWNVSRPTTLHCHLHPIALPLNSLKVLPTARMATAKPLSCIDMSSGFDYGRSSMMLAKILLSYASNISIYTSSPHVPHRSVPRNLITRPLLSMIPCLPLNQIRHPTTLLG